MSNHFPSAIDLADDTLASKPHSTLHGNLGDTLSDYIDALGTPDTTGDYPILFDPAGAREANGWWRIEYLEAPKQISLFLNAAEDASGSQMTFRYTGADTGASTARKALFDGFVGTDDFTVFTDVFFQSQVTADGSFGGGRNAQLSVFSDLSTTGWLVEANDAHLKQTMVAYAGQTDPLLDLQDSDGNTLSSFAPQEIEHYIYRPDGTKLAEVRWYYDAAGDPTTAEGYSYALFAADGETLVSNFTLYPDSFEAHIRPAGVGDNSDARWLRLDSGGCAVEFYNGDNTLTRSVTLDDATGIRLELFDADGDALSSVYLDKVVGAIVRAYDSEGVESAAVYVSDGDATLSVSTGQSIEVNAAAGVLVSTSGGGTFTYNGSEVATV